MNLTLEQFIVYFPEFAAINNFDFSAALRRAYVATKGYKRICDEEMATLALALYTAHVYTLTERAKCHGGNVAVKSVKSQDDQITFVTPEDYGDEDTWLMLTPYGLELLQIYNSFFTGYLI
jgi:Protein of unknown function (DUF4054)